MPSPAAPNSNLPPPSLWSRLLRILRPSHQHSELSATVLVVSAVMLSRVIGYLREMYIAWAFGAAHQTDAYVAAFQIPDWLNYILAGGTASITFISIYTRHTSRGRRREAQARVQLHHHHHDRHRLRWEHCCWKCSRRRWCA